MNEQENPAAEKPTAESMAANIANSLQDDPQARKAFRADPIKFLEKRSGQSLPQGMRVELHENTDTVWHVPLGSKASPVADIQLGPMSGGRQRDARKERGKKKVFGFKRK